LTAAVLFTDLDGAGEESWAKIAGLVNVAAVSPASVVTRSRTVWSGPSQDGVLRRAVAADSNSLAVDRCTERSFTLRSTPFRVDAVYGEASHRPLRRATVLSSVDPDLRTIESPMRRTARTRGPEARGGTIPFYCYLTGCAPRRRTLTENRSLPPTYVITPFLQLSRTFCEQTHRIWAPAPAEFPSGGWLGRDGATDENKHR
jgi:hypothetical protein